MVYKRKYVPKKKVIPKRKYAKKRSKMPIIKKLVSDVRKIKKENKTCQTNGERVYRQRRVDRLLTLSENTLKAITKAGNSITITENALSNLTYYDPTTPTTLVTASGAVGTYSKTFNIKDVYTKIIIRNNYQVPAMVRVYGCIPKEDTSISPSTAYTSGLADMNNPNAENPLMHVTDSNIFNNLWRIDKSMKKLLNSGRQFTMKKYLGDYTYDPSLVDDHALTYQSKYKGYAWFVQVCGAIGHDGDALNDEQGILDCGIDMYVDTVVHVCYDAGKKMKTYVIDDDSATFTTNGVVSNMPISNNQAYRIAVT